MSVVGIFSGTHCHGDEVATRVAEELGLDLIGDRVLDEASSRYGTAVERLRHCMEGPSSILDAFRRDRGRNVAAVREALAHWVKSENAVYHGFGAHLLPRTVSHVYKVCLVASRSYRVQQAMAQLGVNEKKARKILAGEDAQRIQWTQYLFDLGPWDERLYDEIIPMSSMSVEEAVQLIVQNARKEIVGANPQSRSAAEDHLLASRVGVVLAQQGHDVEVTAADGHVTVVLNKYVLRVEHHEAELQKLASGVEGVVSAKTRLGPKFRPPSIHRDLDTGGPGRILLVDDEKEFVHTLSERLEARDLDAAVAYNGEDALSFVEERPPEVMVLDLKMPGIDGLEVLKQVKRDYPGIEVIILTGHGSEVEEQRAEELGAFAYLQKPVEIELLARTMREAHHKAQLGREDAPPPSDATAQGAKGDE